ncbi:hypothetical protein PM082_014509 [Marasmius tenuissimus]|nr:hypothetical protein PM082_014509 [Marasmius tenuissimus]
MSLSRLGCLALSTSGSLPRILLDQVSEPTNLLSLITENTKNNYGSNTLLLKILPRGEIGRATTEVRGDDYEVCYVSLQQRIRFGEEIVQTAQNGGRITATTIDDLVDRILMGTPSRRKDSIGEGSDSVGGRRSKRAVGLGIFKRLCQLCSK